MSKKERTRDRGVTGDVLDLCQLLRDSGKSDLLDSGFDPEPMTPIIGCESGNRSQFVGIRDSQNNFGPADVLHPKVRRISWHTTRSGPVSLIHHH